MRRGNRLRLGRLDTAALLCKLVFDGNLPLLKRMLGAGIAADSADYDMRTALHIAACESNLTSVPSPPPLLPSQPPPSPRGDHRPPPHPAPRLSAPPPPTWATIALTAHQSEFWQPV